MAGKFLARDDRSINGASLGRQTNWVVADGQMSLTAAGDYAQLQLSKQRQIGLSLAAAVAIALSLFSIGNGCPRAVQRP
jgi:hypothetical protein